MSYWDGSRWAPDALAATNSSRPGRRLLGAAAEAGLISLLLVGLIAGTTFAAKGGGKPGGGGSGSYTVTIDQPGPYSFGDAVTVTTNAPAYPNNAGPWISLSCSQNGVVVGTADHAGFPGGWYYGTAFGLGPSSSWTSGAADCTFTVFHMSNKRSVVDATLRFNVDG